jgi:hypothetical protein
MGEDEEIAKIQEKRERFGCGFVELSLSRFS